MKSLRLQPKGNTTLNCDNYTGWNKQGNEHNEQEHQYLGVTERMKENSLSLKTHYHN